jgi:hypothetical protein
MASGPDSPWFPGFRLYRQGALSDWREAIAAVTADIVGK